MAPTPQRASRVRALRRRRLTWALLAGLVAQAAMAQAGFVAREVEVCPASARVYDPEFEPTTQRMLYFDGRSAVRVAAVLPDGRIDGTDCAGRVVARRATISLPDLPFRNGPEWALSARGLEIVFTRLDADGRPSMALASRARRGWQVQVLPDSTERGLPLVSADADAEQPRLVYARITSPGNYALAWREAFLPGSEATVPGDVDPRSGGAPRWVPGQRALTLGLPDPATGVRQAARLDVDSGTVHPLTDDDGDKDEVWLWQAPEYGGAWGLMVVADGCCLRFYREAEGRWQLQRELRATEFAGGPMIISPELLVHEGRSHVVMQVGTSRVSASETWVVGVADDGLAPTRISDPARPDLARSEPEWHVTPAGVFVYVSASAARNRFALHRLDTPLTVNAAAAQRRWPGHRAAARH